MESLRKYYLEKIYEGMLMEDEQMIREYERFLKELDRLEFMRQVYIAKKKERK